MAFENHETFLMFGIEFYLFHSMLVLCFFYLMMR